MVFFTVLSLHFAEGQEPDSNDQADAALTAAYKQALALYPHGSQETLRKAERAWINFSNKNEALINSLRKENLISEERDDQCQLAEVNIRAKHLRTFFCNSGVPYNNPQQALQFSELALTSAYKKAMAQLGPTDQELLRNAERAWIIYRDLNATAVADALHQPYDPPAWTTASRAWLALNRAVQILGELPIGSLSPNQPVAAVTTLAAPATSSPAAEATPTPFDDTKAVTDWQKDAKSAIAELLAKKAGPIFGPVTDLKNIPSIPEDSASKIHDLWHEMILTLRREASHDQKKSPTIILSSEGVTINLLENWINFERLFKAGNFVDASNVLTSQFDHKPAVIPPEYALIWDSLTAWKVVIDKTATPFKEHLTKAKASADLGKSSTAIQEFNAAYSLFPDPSIPEKIKKIREQSLGL